ncbi:MAG TPA: hypothetical protein PKC20_20975 [Burkholderiaceae bacterium]|nr:hypothetical protein [Burkholderiaceae bacterium]
MTFAPTVGRRVYETLAEIYGSDARDLATRLKDAALAQKLTDKRDALLKAHPQLLARKPTAANMHGGVDPITGKEY